MRYIIVTKRIPYVAFVRDRNGDCVKSIKYFMTYTTAWCKG